MSGGGQIEHKIVHDPDPGWIFSPDVWSLSILDFAIALEPGEYTITLLSVKHVDLADEQITLFIDPTIRFMRFTVPESGCSYIGRIFVNYYRLPPLEPFEAINVFKKLRAPYMKLLSTGGIVSESAAIERAPPDERPEGSKDCIVEMAEWEEWE